MHARQQKPAGRFAAVMVAQGEALRLKRGASGHRLFGLLVGGRRVGLGRPEESRMTSLFRSLLRDNLICPKLLLDYLK
jgi:hypothetical protein